MTELLISRRSWFNFRAYGHQCTSWAYPDPYVAIGRAGHAVVGHDGRIREHMDRTGVQARPAFYATTSNHVQVAYTCGLPTVLGGTQFVEVPHYEFAVPRTCEDLVIIAWVLAEIKMYRFRPLRTRTETHFHDPKQRQC